MDQWEPSEQNSTVTGRAVPTQLTFLLSFKATNVNKSENNSYNLQPRAVQVSGVLYVVYVPIVENMANYSVKNAL